MKVCSPVFPFHGCPQVLGPFKPLSSKAHTCFEESSKIGKATSAGEERLEPSIWFMAKPSTQKNDLEALWRGKTGVWLQPLVGREDRELEDLF
ncbi:hypothetical protein I79_009439 [Cricetulus griseus]|uniref:Uncharacterized protein n=1 Tax=Cricetulus griseus TaxID=10029 RepID=G3HFS4_CRIGR|nr:hypothetical protein I79_009439 [Cricetulus griseus]